VAAILLLMRGGTAASTVQAIEFLEPATGRFAAALLSQEG